MSAEINDIEIAGNTALPVVTMTAKARAAGTVIEGKFRYVTGVESYRCEFHAVA